MGLILCKFCRTAFDDDEARRATPCPRCKDLFPETTQKCPRCEVWLVVQCVFCDALTPHQRPECDACGEVFAGAPQRKAAREAAGGSALPWGAPGGSTLPWGGDAASAPASAGSFGDLGSWAAPPPEQAAADLFSSFGKGATGAPEEPPRSSGWDLESWAKPRQK